MSDDQHPIKRAMNKRKQPLYRKVNTTAHGVHHLYGGDYRDERHSKPQNDAEVRRQGMHGSKQRGLDYTPLFRFLLSRAGANWQEVYSEAVSRLDKSEPIFWMVALRQEDEKEFVRTGEASYFSGMKVDGDGLLQLVNPKIGSGSLVPQCRCCTHTFNGIRFTRIYDPDAALGVSAYRFF
ncbi:hypothetical protein [Rhodoferax sp. OV413]|uniref:hypothetical protein n=1 Tax=Rhodoferax sp. OV413 TaxID=1855285 RepID=UPI002100746B|nr:hypothetical protein [Rhodoferax sp. OV413]